MVCVMAHGFRFWLRLLGEFFSRAAVFKEPEATSISSSNFWFLGLVISLALVEGWEDIDSPLETSRDSSLSALESGFSTVTGTRHGLHTLGTFFIIGGEYLIFQ